MEAPIFAASLVCYSVLELCRYDRPKDPLSSHSLCLFCFLLIRFLSGETKVVLNNRHKRSEYVKIWLRVESKI